MPIEYEPQKNLARQGLLDEWTREDWPRRHQISPEKQAELEADEERLQAAYVAAQEEFDAHLGRVLLTTHLHGWFDEDSDELYFDPPIPVRVIETNKNDIQSDCCEWVDPYWSVEILDYSREELVLNGVTLSSPSVCGTSIGVYTPEIGKFEKVHWVVAPDNAYPLFLPE